MLNPSQIAVAALASLVLSATPAVAQPRDVVLEEVTLRGTVAAIDHYQRILTLRGEQGNLVVVDVPVSVVRFDSMRVGDVVTMAYYDRVTLRPKPAGEPAIDRALGTAATPTPGALPGGTIAAQRVTTVTFTGWDPVTRVVNFRGPKGAEYSRRLAENIDAGILSGLRPGDRVDVVWSESIRLSVQGGSTAAPSLGPDERLFSISFLLGPDNSFSGKMIEAATGRTTGGAPINLAETSYDDVYGRMMLFKIGAGYRYNDWMEFAANFVISRSSAETVTIGTVGAANVPLNVRFDDYNYWGAEFGQRFRFNGYRVTPYAGYLVGINRHGDIRGVFVDVPLNLTPGLVDQDGKFFEKSWAFSFGPTAGVLIPVGTTVEIMAETQLRYMGGLSDVDWLVEEGLRDINSESSRWSVPFLFGMRVKF